MDSFDRPQYRQRIEPFMGKPVVKVISGMRRVGKSQLLKSVHATLLAGGVKPDSIFYMNKELLEWDHVRDYTSLWHEIQAYFGTNSAPRYVFIDEVQEIAGWERTVGSMLAQDYADITISGSNAHLLSSELATLLSGRYVEIPVYPLSFREFLVFRAAKAKTEAEEFRLYLKFGGMPGLHSFDLTEDVVFPYLNGLYSTIVLKDVIGRHAIRDPGQLERIVRFVFDNVGNITSAKRVADYLRNQKLSTGMDKVLDYLAFLEQAFLVHRVRRFDLKGLRHLELHEKYFMGDTGLRHGFLGYRDQDVGGILENIVFLELRRQGFAVSVGKIGELEVDFVAETTQERLYVQVAVSLSSPEVVEREYVPLESIRDNHPKLVLSLDEDFRIARNGIVHKHVRDFLLE